MKNTRALFWGLFVCILQIIQNSCTNECFNEDFNSVQSEITVKTRSVPKISDFEEDKLLLAANGYDTTAIVECDSIYLVENEWFFFKSKLKSIRESEGINPRLNYKWMLNPKYQRLFFKVAANYENKLIFKDAVDEWNKLNSSLDFMYDPFNENISTKRVLVHVKIDVNPPMDSSHYMSATELHYTEGAVNGKNGETILINTNYKYWNELSSIEKKYAMMHALGHYTGLNHSKDDIMSIMQDESGLSSNSNLWYGFSFRDENDICSKYPINPAVAKFENLSGAVDKNGSFELKRSVKYNFSTEYIYAWCYDPTYKITCKPLDNSSGNYTFTKTGDTAFSLEFNKAGSCEVVVTAIDEIDGTEYKFSKKFYSSAYILDFKTPTAIEIGKYYDFYASCPQSPNEKAYIYDFSVKDLLFDDVETNVSVEYVKNGHVRIRFNDYGSYQVTSKVTNDSDISARVFCFSKYYRNTSWSISPEIWEGIGEERLALEDNIDFTYSINFGNTLNLEHNVAFYYQPEFIKNEWNLPERINRSRAFGEKCRILKKKGDANPVILMEQFEVIPHQDGNPNHYYECIPCSCRIEYDEDKCYLMSL